MKQGAKTEINPTPDVNRLTSVLAAARLEALFAAYVQRTNQGLSLRCRDHRRLTTAINLNLTRWRHAVRAAAKVEAANNVAQ